MKRLFYNCVTALMLLLAATGLTRAQLVLTFTDLYGKTQRNAQYGKYVPFHAKLTSGGVEQQNFEVYYTLAGAKPSKDQFVAGEELSTGFYRAVATNGVVEFMLSTDGAPFQAVAYLPSGASSSIDSIYLTAISVEKPTFNPPAPQFGKAQVAPNTVVKIVDEEGGAEIYYSIDGSTEPVKALFGKNANVLKYNDADGITITKDVVIRAIAYKSVNGNEGGSDMARGGFEVDNKPQVHLSLNIEDDEWVINQDPPVLTVTTLNGATLGTKATDVAVKLKFTISGATWEQIITQSGTPLDMAKAVAAAQEDACVINCSLVKGNATNTAVSNIVLQPETLGFDIGLPGEPPVPPTFSIPSKSTILKGTSVTLSCETEDAEIYYIVNKDDAPTVKYTKPLVISTNSVIKAISRKGGKSSTMVEAEYTVTNNAEELVTAPDMPTFTVPSGKVVAGTVVYIECATPGVEIRYTTNSTTPKTTSPLYNDNLGITVNEGLTIKAIAIKDGLSSGIAIASYKLVEELETVSKPTFSPKAGEIVTGTGVKLRCATPGAEIRYTVDGSEPTASSTLYTTPVIVSEALTIKAIAIKGELVSDMAKAAYTVKPGTPENPDPPTPDNPDDPTPETVAKPTISLASCEVNAGTVVYIECETPGAEIRYTVDGSAPAKTSALYDRATGIKVNTALTLKAIAVKGDAVSEVAEATYTIKSNDPDAEVITLYFSPASGSEVYAGREINITSYPAKPDVEIFYMMFGSEAEARATEWDQNAAQPFNLVMKPSISKDANTIKAAYVRPGNTAVDNVFFYATYTVREMSDLAITFNPASGSEVEDGATITVTANHDFEIIYNVYADKAEADADEMFVREGKIVEEDGMPVVTKDKPYLRCGMFNFDNARMEYFDAVYTIKSEPPVEPEKIELTFNPASGSEVKDGTLVTVTANREVDIYYNVYADKSAADADDSFILTAYMVSDGMPMITKGKPFLRCGVFDGKMVYFDAAYTVKTTGSSNDSTAVETEFERTVSVYPNPSDGTFNIEVPVAATVEIFAANGALFRHLNLNAGATTVNINRSGIYFLRIAGGGHIAIKRIIVR